MKIATYHTRNFTFTACGSTKEEVGALLIKALKKHGRQKELEKDWFKFNGEPDAEFIENNVTIIDLFPGRVFRDSSILI